MPDNLIVNEGQDGDIEGSIMDALNNLFSTNLMTARPSTDSLKLKKLVEAPLQDDPTAVAPYLTYAPAYQIGRMPDREDGWDIGGPQLWRTFFMAQCGTPRNTTRLGAYKAINELSRRVEREVVRHYDLSNVLANGVLYSPDRTEWIGAMRPDEMWVRTLRRVFGGDQEFYGTALMIWSYRFYRVKDF